MFGVIFLVLGAVIIGTGVRALLLGLKSKQWATASGRLIDSGMATFKQHGNQQTHSYALRYEYEVGSTTYKSKRISFKFLGATTESKRQQYENAEILKVYYDQERPYQAVLDPGINISNILVFAMGLMFIGVGVFYLVSL